MQASWPTPRSAITGDAYIALINCTIENNFHTGTGIGGSSNHFLTQGCVLKDHGVIPDQQWQDWHGCGQLDPAHSSSGQRCIVRYNTLYNNSAHLTWRPFAEKGFSHNWFYHNTLYNTHSAIMESCEEPSFAHGVPIFCELSDETKYFQDVLPVQ